MLFVENNHITDSRLNLAIEEHLLRKATLVEPIFLLYVNEPAVIIGRNQNVFEEVDLDYLSTHNIQLVRRLSGGGAVYHDRGNLNFSFISADEGDLHDYLKFTTPIVNALEKLGVRAELRQRSSLFVGDNKISGNAQYASRGRVLSHGTLLFDTDLVKLDRAVRPRPLPIESKAVQSVRARVANINDLLPKPMTLVQFQQTILRALFGETIPYYPLSAADWTEIEQIRADRYESWAWNIGRSPKFIIRRSRQFTTGLAAVEMEVEKGHIQRCKIETDFLRQPIIDALTSSLIGRRYERESLRQVLSAIPSVPPEILDLLY